MAKALTAELLDEVGLSVRHQGMRKTIDAIRQSRKSYAPDPAHIEFVLSNVAKQIEISVDDILDGRQHNDERFFAVALSTYFLQKKFGYSLPQLVLPLKKSKPVLSRRSMYIEQANLDCPKTEIEKILKNHFDKLTPIINKYLNNGKEQPKQ